MKVKKCNVRDEYTTCNVDELVIDVASKMKENRNINHVIVVKDQEPLGVISMRDIVEKVVAEGKDPSKLSSSDVMTSPIITLNEDDEIEHAARIMTENNLLSLPLVSRENKLLGVVTIYDVVEKLREAKRTG